MLAVITWVFFPFMDCFFVEFNHIMMRLFNRTDCRKEYLSPSWTSILWNFKLGFSSVFYSHSLHEYLTASWQDSLWSPILFYLWIDNRTDHLNILHLHGLHLRELLNWLVFCIVRHISYRNRIHPLGTLFWVLKASLLPFIARSIFRIIIFIHSKTSSHHKTWL